MRVHSLYPFMNRCVHIGLFRSVQAGGDDRSSPKKQRTMNQLTNARTASTTTATGASPSHRILLIEDDPSYRDAISRSLEREGYAVETAEDGSEGLTKFKLGLTDLVVLDVMLPRMSGIDVCREIRRVSDIPIIFLSARSTELDVVIGLEVGADDYIAKPFRVRELQARIRTALRRRPAVTTGPPGEQETFEYDGLRVDLARHEVTVNGDLIAFPRKEFQVLSMLVRNAGRAVSRDDLIAQIWGIDYFGDTKTLDVHIKRIRRRLEGEPETDVAFDDSDANRRIFTVRGYGYKFEPGC
jgi:two-component system, OmpR family, response regulator RegX3